MQAHFLAIGGSLTHQAVIRLMSSGNVDGADMLTFAKQITANN